MGMDRKSLDDFGRTWVKFIKEEAKKDALKSTFIPRSKDFYNSFSYAVELEGTVAIYSTWPWLGLIVDGTRGKYKMAWLTQERGLNVVPLVQRDGSIAFRTVPLTIGDAWIHPKIAQHTFLNRAYDRALTHSAEAILVKAFAHAPSRKR